jgi:hypothetical protein
LTVTDTDDPDILADRPVAAATAVRANGRRLETFTITEVAAPSMRQGKAPSMRQGNWCKLTLRAANGMCRSPVNLSAALMPAAGAHCNTTDICLAGAISAPATQRMSSNRSEINLRNAATSAHPTLRSCFFS